MAPPYWVWRFFFLNGKGKRCGKEHLNHFGKTFARGLNIWIYQTGENHRGPKLFHWRPGKTTKWSIFPSHHFFPPASFPGHFFSPQLQLIWVWFMAWTHLITDTQTHYFMSLWICHRCLLLNLSERQTDGTFTELDKPLSTNITNSNTTAKSVTAYTNDGNIFNCSGCFITIEIDNNAAILPSL